MCHGLYAVVLSITLRIVRMRKQLYSIIEDITENSSKHGSIITAANHVVYLLGDRHVVRQRISPL
jgi:hypothetical protein